MVIKLALAEIIEGVTPIYYAIWFAMAYYGPNGTIIGNVKSNLLGYSQVDDDDVQNLFLMMSLLLNWFI